MRRTLDFAYTLLDAGAGDEAALAQHLRLQAILLGLKYGTRPDAEVERLVEVIASVVRALLTGPGFLPRSFITSVVRRYSPVEAPALERALKLADTDKEEEMLSLAARQWLAQGQAEGESRGAATTLERNLRRLLTRRFGALPESLDQRIAQADTAQLDRWFDLALDASSLDQVFSPEH